MTRVQLVQAECLQARVTSSSIFFKYRSFQILNTALTINYNVNHHRAILNEEESGK